MKDEVIKDVFGRNVFVGQQVGVLVKCYGFRGIDRAYLMRATYLGKGRYGYEFKCHNERGWKTVVRIRQPEVVKK